jgi:hypothetical protein
MSEVARTFAKRIAGGKHARRVHPASQRKPQTRGQATGRQKKVVKELEWGTRPRATKLALPSFGSRGRAPHLHSILKDGADARVNDSQFRSDTEMRRHQYGSPRVESSQTLPICSGNVRVPDPGGGQPDA